MTRNIILAFFCITCLLITENTTAEQLDQSSFNLENQKIRYDIALALNSDESLDIDQSAGDNSRGSYDKPRSPAKAFFLSLVVPGMGQFYNGSKFKSVGFLGAEVTAWVFYSKWHGEADDMTDEFERFNREHWSEVDYQTFLLWTYGYDDDELINAKEMSHHLPDTRTQQYYEMTGKYDQFSWGWDDANLDGDTLYSFSSEDPPPPVNVDENIPYTAHRLQYEQMRKDTDGRYKRARRMIFVSMANRLISAFEALIAAKKHNNQIDDQVGSILSRVRMKASLKSYSAKQDTPFVTFTYKF